MSNVRLFATIAALVLASLLFSLTPSSERTNPLSEEGALPPRTCLTRADCEGLFQYVAPEVKPDIDAYLKSPDIKELWKDPLPRVRDPADPGQVSECAAQWEAMPNIGRRKSTHGEDLSIYRRFFARRSLPGKGVFLELGAFNGWDESNTRFFERCLGWSGVLVEASPAPFKLLAEARVRPTAHKLQLAPSCAADNGTISFDGTVWTNSMALSIREEHGQNIHPERLVDVHCGPLALYLRELDVETIDFLSLDVEGSEPLVLGAFDFDAVRVGVLMVENQNRFNEGGNSPKNRRVRKIMTERWGYRMMPPNTAQHSDVFVAPGFAVDDISLL